MLGYYMKKQQFVLYRLGVELGFVKGLQIIYILNLLFWWELERVWLEGKQLWDLNIWKVSFMFDIWKVRVFVLIVIIVVRLMYIILQFQIFIVSIFVYFIK